MLKTPFFSNSLKFPKKLGGGVVKPPCPSPLVVPVSQRMKRLLLIGILMNNMFDSLSVGTQFT